MPQRIGDPSAWLEADKANPWHPFLSDEVAGDTWAEIAECMIVADALREGDA